MGLVGDFASRRKITVHIASIAVTVFGLASGVCSFTQYLPLMILYMAVVGLLEGMFWVVVPLMMYEVTGGIHADYAYSLMIVLTATGYLTGPSSMGKNLVTKIVEGEREGERKPKISALILNVPKFHLTSCTNYVTIKIG